jgi:hypothetical protein
MKDPPGHRDGDFFWQEEKAISLAGGSTEL